MLLLPRERRGLPSHRRSPPPLPPPPPLPCTGCAWGPIARLRPRRARGLSLPHAATALSYLSSPRLLHSTPLPPARLQQSQFLALASTVSWSGSVSRRRAVGVCACARGGGGGGGGVGGGGGGGRLAWGGTNVRPPLASVAATKVGYFCLGALLMRLPPTLHLLLACCGAARVQGAGFYNRPVRAWPRGGAGWRGVHKCARGGGGAPSRDGEAECALSRKAGEPNERVGGHPGGAQQQAPRL